MTDELFSPRLHRNISMLRGVGGVCCERILAVNMAPPHWQDLTNPWSCHVYTCEKVPAPICSNLNPTKQQQQALEDIANNQEFESGERVRTFRFFL